MEAPVEEGTVLKAREIVWPKFEGGNDLPVEEGESVVAMDKKFHRGDFAGPVIRFKGRSGVYQLNKFVVPQE